MNTELKVAVTALLETYPERERKIAVLRYELSHPSHVSSDELIEAMSLGHEDGVGRPSGHVSDKTLYIALNYQEKADKLNADIKEEIVSQLVGLEQTQNRLKYYVSLLEQRQAETIKLAYFEPVSQEMLAKTLGLSLRTVQKIKAQAIEALAELYSFTENLH